jgi:hypothetical protein
MTRLQRLCLGTLILEVLFLQAAFVEVLSVYTPLHLAKSAVAFFLLLSVLAMVGLVVEK